MPRKLRPKPIGVNDIVYLRTDPDKLPRQVVDIIWHASTGETKFKVVCGDKTTKCFEWELEREGTKRVVITGLKPDK